MRPKIAAFLAIALVCAAAPTASAASPQPTTFQYVGAEQSYTVPAGVTDLKVTAVGAPGGAGSFGPHSPRIVGGLGAAVTSDLAVTPGEVLFVEVGGPGGEGDANGGGGPGFNGGGLGGRSFGGSGGGAFGGGGGGASDVRLCSTTATGCAGAPSSLASRLLVAGGGGGGGGAQLNDAIGGQGGDAAAVGSPGYAQSGGGGGGATQSAGGIGGTGGLCAVATSSGMSGSDGILGSGGTGGYGVAGEDDAWGGGGGGGYYGGGGGGDGCAAGGGGGGGGSSYGPAGTTFATAVRGAESPFVTITPLEASGQITPATLSFASQAPSTVSLPQTVTIKNTGNAPLTISGLTFAGAAANDFLVGSSSCGGRIAPSASCQLTIRFAPSVSGTRTATLDITSNDPASPTGVQLSGTGAQPSPSGSPAAGQPASTPVRGGSSSQPAGTPVPSGSSSQPVPSTTLGAVKLLSCHTRAVRVRSGHGTVTRRVYRCGRRSLSANAQFPVTATPTRATLTRHGVVYAMGASSHGLLVLRSSRSIAAGAYVLTLNYGGHQTTVTVVVS